MRHSPHKSRCVGPSRHYTLLPGLRKQDVIRCSATSNLRIGKTCTSHSNERYFNDWPLGVEAFAYIGKRMLYSPQFNIALCLGTNLRLAPGENKIFHFLPLFPTSPPLTPCLGFPAPIPFLALNTGWPLSPRWEDLELDGFHMRVQPCPMHCCWREVTSCSASIRFYCDCIIRQKKWLLPFILEADSLRNYPNRPWISKQQLCELSLWGRRWCHGNFE